MPGGRVSSAADIVASLRAPRTIQLDSTVCKRGIDNYHIDVQLDPDLILHARQVIEDMVKRAVAGKRPSSTPAELAALSKSYEDTVRTSLHRTKTDLQQTQVAILHFAIVKFVLREVRNQLDAVLKQTEETLSQQQYSGSRSLLVTQERFAWLRSHYARFAYRVGRAVLKHLHREENNQIRQLREHFLGDVLPELANILFNPMLAALNPLEPDLLVENYALWPMGGKEFTDANSRFEGLIAERIPDLKVAPLKSIEKLQSAQTEIYDELGGLFAVQDLLGPSVDQRETVSESFSWLEHPGNLRYLFDASVHEDSLNQIDGIRAQWSFKADIKKLAKLGIEARKQLASDTAMKEIVAGYVLREDWHPAYDEFLEVDVACSYLAGNDTKKILARIDQSREGGIGFVRKLEEWEEQAAKALKQNYDELSLRVLADLSRFRLHLYYCRFAHRIFNRLNLVTEPEQIQLSLAGGHLYQLLNELEETSKPSEPVIVHHTILKADVRGSTTVTQELIKQNLNPAAYFSTRFFGPITELLGVYGAVKVFIEGDAVILGIVEHDNAPDQWYSVARACGVAKEMLDIVNSKNTNSAQSGLPMLEIGIGVCYADERPLFLFDEDRPIMISPAIGSADRLSSCSRKLRQVFSSHEFNVEVLSVKEEGEHNAEKGESHLRYNVNGILLANEAFRKLMSEISLKKIKVRVGDGVETMFVGRFPDVRGKDRDLVIREALIGTWQDDQVSPGIEGGPCFYEVLPNSKRASQVLELVRSQSGGALE